MVDVAGEEFMQRFAPDDVRAAVRWLLDTGYQLARAQIGASDWAALFVYAGDAEVQVGVEHSPWYMDIAPTQGEPRYVVMWPDSHKAKQLRASWRVQGLPMPDRS